MTDESQKVQIFGLRDMLQESEVRLVAGLGPPHEDVEEYYSSAQLPDGHHVKFKVFRSNKTPAAQRPLVLMFHGGGFMCGSVEMCTRPGREFAQDFGAVVVSASYRLAPEHRFPGGVRDGLDVVAWVDRHGEETFGANLTAGFVVGGLSAGATIAALAAQRLKDLQHPITGSFLSIAMLMAKEIVPEKYQDAYVSRLENNDGPTNGEWLDDMAETLGIDYRSPLFSPLNNPEGLGGIPRTYIQTGGKDPLRDDGLVYAKMLDDAGREVRWDNHEELAHECFAIWANENSPPALKQKTMEGMAWLLRREWP